MAFFIPVLAKKYSPYDIDAGMFALQYPAVRSVPVVCTKMIASNGYGEATVNSKPISKGRCVKFDFSPLPIYFLPVGEAATEFGKKYTVRLRGYRDENGKKFRDITFTVQTAKKLTDDKKHRAVEKIAKNVSDEGIVLLKNSGVLPLPFHTKIKLLGEYQNYRITATGASLIKPRWSLNMKEAIAQCEALELADDAETALYFISRGSSENRDNKPIPGNYYLTDDEKASLTEAVQKYKNVILILNTGYPVEMRFIKSLRLSAVLWTGFSGQRGTESLCDILCGRVNPSGKLADTWPLDYFDTPASHNFINLNEDSPVYSDDGKKYGAQIYYEEQQFVGYRYFDTFKKEEAYSFGHGLSYTDFSVHTLAGFENGILKVDVQVTNTGTTAGKTAVLAYVQFPDGGRMKPARVFCGFEKTKLLACGERQTLHIEIPQKDFSVYDAKKAAFLLEAGQYKLWVGGSMDEAECAFDFFVDKEMIVSRLCAALAPTEPVGSIKADGSVEERSKIMQAQNCILSPAAYSKRNYEELPAYKGRKLKLADVKKDGARLDDFVAQFTTKELVNFTVCNGHCFSPWKNGAAGKLASSRRLGVPVIYMSDGNCGVNVNARTTGFPASNLLAGTMNKELAYAVGKAIAADSREQQIAINLGPGGNLHRNILCGRHSEYFSEDPILAGTMMAFQAKGLEDNGVIATYKHLLANGIEFERKSAHSIIDTRTVYELYLRVFDKALSLYKPGCMMTSYNPVNGIYPCENTKLLNDIIRDGFGFDGFIMTDWGSYDTADPVRCVNAGTNLLTPGDKKHFRQILRAAKSGEISKATLQNSVKQIIKVLVKCI
ncbi:MAG TPA: glycoside hydrolase family 3 C-terminal domain-containing protein [Candidatus Fimivicinus intestinavium]|nr:glycoside hydrolase family 3 C-terminal domain-containing protein [Candidatus Fimivicinus intestinavium]